MWVPLIENDEAHSKGADYFVQKEINALLSKNPNIDSILLGCTHYPILEKKIRKFLPSHIQIINQGKIVAQSFIHYLKQHPEIEQTLIKQHKRTFYTTENATIFNTMGSAFFGEHIEALHIKL
jgi:glutamate racemase